jgi:hypothetical protein
MADNFMADLFATIGALVLVFAFLFVLLGGLGFPMQIVGFLAVIAIGCAAHRKQ